VKGIHFSQEPIRTGGGTDLAFAVMVLAGFFTTFSLIQNITPVKLILLILLGMLYLANGIYGYAYCAHRDSDLAIGLYFFSQLVLGVLIIVLGGTVGFNAVMLLPLAGHSVVLLSEVPRYVVNGIMVALYALAVRWLSGGWEESWAVLPVFIAGQVFILVFTQMAVAEEQAKHEVQKLVKDLETANQNLRSFALRAEETAIVQERNRMAREIHDGLGHHLTALNMQIRAARAVLRNDASRALDLLSNAEGLTQKALVDVRNSVSALREDESSASLPEQIESALKVCLPSGLAVSYVVQGELRPTTPQVNMALSRAAQECVNNVLKHSGAKKITVSLDYSSPGIVRFDFTDDGRGSAVPKGGFGLIGMRERVLLLEGEISIKTAKGEGFGVEISLPG
jgi:signal transduction histidine kinase